HRLVGRHCLIVNVPGDQEEIRIEIPGHGQNAFQKMSLILQQARLVKRPPQMPIRSMQESHGAALNLPALDLGHVLFDPEPHDSGNELQGQRLIEWELHRALGALETGQLRGVLAYPRWSRVETDMTRI